jgi:hypothetical protein
MFSDFQFLTFSLGDIAVRIVGWQCSPKITTWNPRICGADINSVAPLQYGNYLGKRRSIQELVEKLKELHTKGWE